MFTTTPDQEYILSILSKTRFMRVNQACKLLKLIDEAKVEIYAVSLLKQLKHMEKIAWKSEKVFALPSLYRDSVDEEMLAAIDIMIDLTDSKILSLSANNPPYKLCFLTEQGDNVGNYAIISVAPGSEMTVTATLSAAATDTRTVIFLLSDISQKNKIKTTLPHFFALYDANRYRYFKGGEP